MGDGTSAPQKALEEKEEMRRYAYKQNLSLYGTDAAERIDKATKMWIEKMKQQDIEEYPLANGRKYVPHTLPESPDELFINFRNARMERVFNCFGIPLGITPSHIHTMI